MSKPTKETWEQILQEYANASNTYLCSASGTFHKLWGQEESRNEIRTIAQQFLNECKIVGYWLNDEKILLFERMDGSHDARAIREQFLQWCVK